MRSQVKHCRIYVDGVDDIVVAYVPEINKVYVLDSSRRDQIPDSIAVDESQIVWEERPPSDETKPIDLVLLLTSACNLACQYCYSDAGEASHIMNASTASRAVAFVADTAKQIGKKGISILFHGEGEPTANWPVLTETVDFAKEYTASLGLSVRFSIATNGIYGDDKRGYLSQQLHNITLSLDGPRYINDAQRPRRGRSSSFNTAFESAQYFYSHRSRLNFGIRSTLLPQHIETLPEIVRFIGLHFPSSQLSVEPVEFVGRYSKHNRHSFEGFAFAYRRARREAKRHNLRFWYSAVRGPRKSDFFCGVAGRSMVVGPTGLISGCSRVSRENHTGARNFIYGKFELGRSAPSIDPTAKNRLETYSGTNMLDCQNCIAYTWCRGDCRHIRYMANGNVLNGVSPRCREIRTIVLGELMDSAHLSMADKYLQSYYTNEATLPVDSSLTERSSLVQLRRTP